MSTENIINRRRFVSLSSGLVASFPASSALLKPSNNSDGQVPQENLMERFTLDLGHRATRSGPVANLDDNSLLWVTTEPEPPYLAKAMWPISRLVVRRSKDGGKSWGESQILQQGTSDYSLLSHVLRQSTSGKILHIFVRYSGYDYETGTPEKSLCKIYFQTSNDRGQTWSKAQALVTGERYHGDILSIEQLSSGRWIYPICFLTNIKSQFAVSVMVSDDDGETWERSESILTAGGAGFESGASEPTVCELNSGVLWMLIRAQTGFLWESFSYNQGQTWTTAIPSQLPSSNAPATGLKLRNGDIAIVWNNHIDSNYARKSLVIGLTADGKNFKGLREIDFADFRDDLAITRQHVTYPYLTEMKDGTIIVSYNKGNWGLHNQPTLARINPAWITTKHELINFQDGRTDWHIICPGPNYSHAVERYVSLDDKLWLEIEQHPKSKAVTGIIRNIPLLSNGKIQITAQIPKADAYILIANSLLSPRKPDEGCVRIRFTDMGVYFATGKANRSRNDRKITEYLYTSFQIREEIQFPDSINNEKTLNISVEYKSDENEVRIQINNSTPISLKTEKFMGLSYMGFLVDNGGQIRIQQIETSST
ncbi:MAG: exo-alpha-sialidase [Saprospiraceae bacterium]|nr:exo-alpha-sialidase [Saprospiraceae bacterium]